MTHENEKPPIEPRKYFLLGLALPGVIILACAGIGILVSVYNNHTELSELKDAATTGAAVGLFFSLYGVGELVGGILGGSNRLMNGVYQSLGYLLVWGVTLSFIVPTLSFD